MTVMSAKLSQQQFWYCESYSDYTLQTLRLSFILKGLSELILIHSSEFDIHHRLESV